MTYSTNLPTVLQTVNLKLTDMQREKMTRLQATSLLAIMRDRIHVQGKDSNGSQIGTYTPAYIKYTRAKSGRGTDNKVILSLTRQMENGYELYKLDNGTGIGFTTQEDMQKARWCEQTYQKPIFAPTAEEKAMVMQIADNFIAKHLHG
jgi:hypothetical protein